MKKALVAGSLLLMFLVAVAIPNRALSAADGSASDAAIDPAHDPMTSVKTVIDQAIAIFKDPSIAPASREHELRAIAESRFDFENMARSAVGYHWRDFTEEQRAQFVPLFTAFIEDVYLSRMEQYSVEKVKQAVESSNIQFTKERIDGPDEAQVFSTVT